MHKFSANVFLLSIAVVATTRVGLEKFDNPRVLRGWMPFWVVSSINPFLTIPSEATLKRSVSPLKDLPQTASPVDKGDTLTPEDLFSIQGTKNDVKYDFELLLKEIKACRKSFPNMSDRKFSFKLYNDLLNELIKAPNEPSIRTFCNISEGLVDGLKDTLHDLDVFPTDLPNSTEFPGPTENPQQTKESETIYSRRNIVRVEVENNLNLNLGDEWIPLHHKVNHMSHIYLGRSLFPLITEESRILDKYHTLPSPSTTKRTYLSGEGNDNLKVSRTVEKVHQLLLPIRWHVQAKRKALRAERSVKDTAEESPGSSTKSTVRINPTNAVPSSPNTDSASKKPTTKKPLAKKARRPYSSILEFLLSSWKDELTKINKSLLFD